MAAQSILLTRPAEASARFAAALRDVLGPETPILIAPLMVPVFLAVTLPAGPFDAVILTSETGVAAARHLGGPGNLPVLAYCVGHRTARQASEAGFTARSADGDAGALLDLIRRDLPEGRYLYLHGKDSRGDVAARLRDSGAELAERVVYDQRPCPMTPEASALLAGSDPVLVPLFSPRSADLLAAFAPFAAPLWVAALSPAVADHASALAPRKLAVAKRPDADVMLQAVQSLWGAGSQT